MSLLGKRSSRGTARGGKKPAGRGRPRSVSAPAVLTADLVPKKRKQWRDEDMNAAIHAVHDGQLKVTEAAKKFSVPRQTLGDRISGKVVHGTKPGPQPYLYAMVGFPMRKCKVRISYKLLCTTVDILKRKINPQKFPEKAVCSYVTEL